MKTFDEFMEEETGYKLKTTFYSDFSIADKFGAEAIKDTYNRAFKEWKNNVEYITELAMVLNWKMWEWNETDGDFQTLYCSLWKEIDEWCMNNLKDEDLLYYINTTD